MSGVPHPRPSFGRGLALIAGAGLAFRLAVALLVTGEPRPFTDPEYYRLLADVIAQGEGFVRPYDFVLRGANVPTAEHPPLHPLVLGAASWLGLGSLTAHKVLLCLLGTGTVVAIGLLGRRIGGNRVGLAAAAIGACYPLLVLADGSLMAESLYGLLIAASLLAAYRLADHPSWRPAAALGALLGLAALTRSEALLLVPLLGLPLAWGGGAGRLRRAGALVATLVVVLLPWSIRNAVTFERPVPLSTNESVTLVGANCAETYRAGELLGYWNPDCNSPVRFPAEESQQAAVWRREGLDHATGHLGRLPIVLGTRVLGTWDLYRPERSVGRQAGDELRNLTLQKLGTGMYYLLLPLATLGLVLLRRRGTRILPLVAPALAVTLSSVASYGLERFRFAAEVPLVVAAAVACVALAERSPVSWRRATKQQAQAQKPLPESPLIARKRLA